MSTWWEKDIDAIRRDLEENIRQAERCRYPGGELPLTLREVGVCLEVSDQLRRWGILEVSPELFRTLVDQAIAAGVGKEPKENGQ